MYNFFKCKKKYLIKLDYWLKKMFIQLRFIKRKGNIHIFCLRLYPYLVVFIMYIMYTFTYCVLSIISNNKLQIKILRFMFYVFI